MLFRSSGGIVKIGEVCADVLTAVEVDGEFSSCVDGFVTMLSVFMSILMCSSDCYALMLYLIEVQFCV